MIKPADLLTLAEKLVQSTEETEWRSAVSRAYYAAFHGARNLMRDLKFRVPRAGVAHAYLWMRLANCGDATIAMAGNDLNDLQSWRNEADYDLDHDLNQQDAIGCVRSARLILQRLASGHSDPVRSQITAGIRDYERNVLRAVTWQGP